MEIYTLRMRGIYEYIYVCVCVANKTNIVRGCAVLNRHWFVSYGLACGYSTTEYFDNCSFMLVI
jgi:hypothetical protein